MTSLQFTQKKFFHKLNHYDSVIIFSTADWNNPFWTNKQHTAVQLQQAGFKVFYIESMGLRQPTLKTKDLKRIWHRLLSFFKGAREVRPNLYVYSPFVIPLHRFYIVKKINQILLLLTLYYYQKKLSFKNTIGWTYNPIVFKILKKLSFSLNIYHSVDDLSAAPLIDKTTIENAEIELFKFINLTFVTSLSLKNKYEQDVRISKAKPIIYLSNVADYEHFSQYNNFTQEEKNKLIPQEVTQIAQPRIGFIGAISSYKVDFHFLHELSQKKPNWNIILIGEIGEGDPHTKVNLLEQKNIFLLGPKKYSELPKYLLGFDIALLPCPINQYTISMFPMKFFEYLSAEKVVFSTALPSLDEHKNEFTTYTSVEDFIEKAQLVFEHKIMYTPSMKQLAQKYTWQNRLKEMFQQMENQL